MKLQNFWWVLVVLAIFACGREGTTIDNILPPTNLELERVGDDLINISWHYENSNLLDDEINQLVLERLIGVLDEANNPWKEISIIDIADPADTTNSADEYMFEDKGLTIQDNFSYRVKAMIDGEASEWTSKTLVLKEVSFFRFTHDGVLILEPGDSQYLEIELQHNDSIAVDADYEVELQFVSVPDGTNINGSLFGNQNTLLISSKDGIVPLTLNGGQVSGVVSIKAKTNQYTTDNLISTVLPNILVQAAPATVKIYPGEANTAQAAGAFWSLDIGAEIQDSNEDYVEDGISVSFSLLDNQDIFTIVESADIGNSPQAGDSVEGFAFSTLKYFGIHTNRTVTVQVQCQDAIRTEVITLPIQYPYFDLEVEPGLILWDSGDHDPKPCNISFRLLDGLNYPILGQAVQYYAIDEHNGEGLVGSVLTSSESGNYGYAEFTWMFNEDDCPRPNEFASIYETKIILLIPGLEELFEIPVTLSRNP